MGEADKVDLHKDTSLALLINRMAIAAKTFLQCIFISPATTIVANRGSSRRLSEFTPTSGTSRRPAAARPSSGAGRKAHGQSGRLPCQDR